jgi:hypothetical protein
MECNSEEEKASGEEPEEVEEQEEEDVSTLEASHRSHMEELEALALLNSTSSLLMMQEQQEEEEEEDSLSSVDHRMLPRKPKIKHHHERVHKQLIDNWFGPNPRFSEKRFKSIYRISIARFNRMKLDAIMSGIPFYCNQYDIFGEKGPCLEARLLLPLRVLAYGVSYNAFYDVFEMSDTMARKACEEFDNFMRQVYQEEYLRLPTEEDLASITKLHKSTHKRDGMFGSLDCMHVAWNKCPVAWKGSYKGAKGKPTVVLEAIADYHCWFWHAAFGYCGTLNDKTILDLSPFLKALVDGSFTKKEEGSGAVPFKIGDEEFKQLYVLVDGIYPTLSRFVQGMSNPVYANEKKFTAWQESARKDIERAFGILQGKFQYMARPVNGHDLKGISMRVATCLILHNMCVSDRVMSGDVNARYDPAITVEKDDSFDIPEDRAKRQKRELAEIDRSHLGLQGQPTEMVKALTRRKAWEDLEDTESFIRLRNAIMSSFSKKRKRDGDGGTGANANE